MADAGKDDKKADPAKIESNAALAAPDPKPEQKAEAEGEDASTEGREVKQAAEAAVPTVPKNTARKYAPQKPDAENEEEDHSLFKPSQENTELAKLERGAFRLTEGILNFLAGTAPSSGSNASPAQAPKTAADLLKAGSHTQEQGAPTAPKPVFSREAEDAEIIHDDTLGNLAAEADGLEEPMSQPALAARQPKDQLALAAPVASAKHKPQMSGGMG